MIKLEELAGLRFVWDARIFIADLIPALWPSPPSLGRAHSEPTHRDNTSGDGFCAPRDDAIISPHFEIDFRNYFFKIILKTWNVKN